MMDKLFDGSDAHLLPGNAELIQRLNEPELYYPGNFDTVKRANAILMCLCQEAANALEAADKRIAKLESGWAACHAQLAESCDERYKLERKLDVSREALKGVIAWSQLRTIENVAAETDLVGEYVPIRLTGLKTCVAALAQIGGDDAS